MKDIFDALVLGLRDYAHKSGFKQALVALSGGIDSAVVGVIAAAAFGAGERHRRQPALRHLEPALAGTTRGRSPPISASASRPSPSPTWWPPPRPRWDPVFAGRPRDVTEENIQARVRGVLMMALSNKFGSLLLTTGNKSEMAVGYCTLYGDMCGGLAVISDVFKTQVYALARWINDDARRAGRAPPIPQSSIDKPPSAELRPDQTDQDSLPPYDLLDAILRGYVEEGLSRRDLVAQGFPEAVVNDVVRKVDLNEYKRKQAAPGLKITPLAFGVGRRIPIVQKYVS